MAKDSQTGDQQFAQAAPQQPKQPEPQSSQYSHSEQTKRRSPRNGDGAARAVCVGINNYGGVNTLPSCVADAQAFAAMLRTDYGFDHVAVLTDDQATAANVQAGLEQIFQNSSPADRLVFFYSGHGYSSIRNGNLEQSLVFKGGSQGFEFFYGDQLAQLTQGLPPGCLTVVLDCCFSGGMYKQLLMPVNKGFYVAERAKVKAWTPVESKDFDASLQADLEAASVRRFGEGVSIRTRPQAEAAVPLALKTLFRSTAAPENQATLVLNGLLMSACRDDQTAAASTSQTDGKSAYTFCLLQAINALGTGATAQALEDEAARRLQALGLQQTPTIKEPAAPPHLAQRPFAGLAAHAKGLGGTIADQQIPGWPQWLANLGERLSQEQGKNLNLNTGASIVNPLITLLLANQNSQPQQNQSQNDLVKALILSQAFSSSGSGAQRQQTKGFDVSSILPLLFTQQTQQTQSRGYTSANTTNAASVLLAAAAAAPDQKSFWDDVVQTVITVGVPAVIGAL